MASLDPHADLVCRGMKQMFDRMVEHSTTGKLSSKEVLEMVKVVDANHTGKKDTNKVTEMALSWLTLSGRFFMSLKNNSSDFRSVT
jgi:hypothetical protein